MSITVTFKRSKLFLAVIILFVDFQYVFGQESANGGNTEDWILKLYGKYKEAVLDGLLNLFKYHKYFTLIVIKTTGFLWIMLAQDRQYYQFGGREDDVI